MGVGALYIGKRPRVRVEPLFNGGGQEKNIRSGTLPAPLVVGFGLACEIGQAEMSAEAGHLGSLRDRLLARVTELDGVHVNGSLSSRVAGNLNVSVEGARAEDLITALPDLAFSTGSACSSANEESSYVLRAIGVSNDLAEASLRFGLGRFTTEAEIDYAGERLAEEITNVRGRKARAAE
jgi:cysteine desulfurase